MIPSASLQSHLPHLKRWMKKNPPNSSRHPSALDPIPEYITHYFESSAGPFKNICDLNDAEIEKIKEMELSSDIKWSRFKIWPEFMKSRRAADDLLMRAYEEKFKKKPDQRPIFAVLGDFHQIPGLYANPERIRVEISDLREDQITFMYPDHAHLIQYYNYDAPAFGAPLPKDYDEKKTPYYGKLFTYKELHECHIDYGIKKEIDLFLSDPTQFVRSYVEAHIWTHDIPHRPC